MAPAARRGSDDEEIAPQHLISICALINSLINGIFMLLCLSVTMRDNVLKRGMSMYALNCFCRPREEFARKLSKKATGSYSHRWPFPFTKLNFDHQLPALFDAKREQST